MSAPTFLGYISHQVIKPAIKKGWLSGEYVIVEEYLICSSFLYEMCAALGYHFRDRLMDFVGLLFSAGEETKFIPLVSRWIASRLEKVPKEPHDFNELYIMTEAETVMKIFIKKPISIYSLSFTSDYQKMAKRKLPFNDVYKQLQLTAMEGIGLGSIHPELTAKLFSNTGDVIDAPIYSLKRKTMQERQTEAISLIKPYLEKFNPTMLTKLELSR